MNDDDQEQLRLFLEWLQLNKVELRGCSIKYAAVSKGLGVFFSPTPHNEQVHLVVPLDLAITPMRVLQDSFIGPHCRAMFEEGEVDDRFLITLFLLTERLRKNSSWKPYLDMLPSKFGNPLWFTDEELLHLKGSALYHATQLQKKQLLSLFEEKVENMLKKVLAKDGDCECEVRFEDFLWANSVFWSRAMNIPLPHSYVFPSNDSNNDDTVWVEGIIPGIDFCNHDFVPQATWEVDVTGATSGVPFSMYLLSADGKPFISEREITINYGKKGNEELLYLYGFVMKDNPDDYLMIHYPLEALQNVVFADSKMQILEAQNAELRHLLPKSLLHQKGKLVFPEDVISPLRIISMEEHQVHQFSSLLHETTENGERQPTHEEVRAAVLDICGNSKALQLLIDLLQKRLMDLEENTGTEDCDSLLLNRSDVVLAPNEWSSIVYRRGQKQLAKAFLKEAQRALDLILTQQIE